MTTYTATYLNTQRYQNRAATAIRLRIDRDGEPVELMTVGSSDRALLGLGEPNESYWSSLARLSVDAFRDRLSGGSLRMGTIEIFVEDAPTVRRCFTDSGTPLGEGDAAWTLTVEKP